MAVSGSCSYIRMSREEGDGGAVTGSVGRNVTMGSGAAEANASGSMMSGSTSRSWLEVSATSSAVFGVVSPSLSRPRPPPFGASRPGRRRPASGANFGATGSL